jgi:two-component system, NarL family, invasion response regulator UvrY
MKILIADDHAIVREGLKQILAEAFPNASFGLAENAGEILEWVRRSRWDLLVLDITMPGPSGLNVLKELAKARPTLPVLVISMHPVEQYGERCLRAGAKGYLTKDSALTDMVEAARKILDGGIYVSPSLGEKLAANLRVNGQKSIPERFSDRELEVLRLIVAGKTVKEIAAQLSLSPKTVSTYRVRLLTKTGLEKTAQLVRFAWEQGMAD